MMTEGWLAMVGPVALIVILIAVHAVYFRLHFRFDTRYAIGVPAGAEFDETRSSARENLSSLDIAARDLPDGGQFAHSSSRLPTEPAAAPVILARRIVGHDCGRIDVRAIHATERLDLAAQSLRSEALIVGGAARLRLGEISVSRLSSPDLRLQRDPRATDSCGRKPSAVDIRRHARDVTPLIVMHSSVIEPGAVVTQPMIVYGDMDVGFDAMIATSLKVHGNLRLAENVTVTAPMVANGDVLCGTECHFMSDLVVKGTLVVRHGTRFGWAGRSLVTIIARRIRLSDRHEISGSMMSSLPFEVQYGV